MNSRDARAFSLVEVVIALGIFTFCITILLGLIPVGLKSARSVSEEGNAVHIASSIFAFWQQAPTNTPLVIPGIISNSALGVGAVTTTPSTNFFDDTAAPASASTASLAMVYRSTNLPGIPNGYEVELGFRWPARAPANAAGGVQTRTYKEVFVK
jgi:type II secretory pathway pseudopilin PulG